MTILACFRGAGIIVGAALLALGAFALAQPAEPARAQIGTWLIEPDSFDPFAELHRDAPWFPLLVVRGDGTFTLFRAAPNCDPYAPENGESLDWNKAEGLLRVVAICDAAAKQAAKDGFIAAYLHVSAAGRWSLQDGRIRFAAGTKGVHPPEIAKSFAGLRAQLASDAAKPHVAARTLAAITALGRILDAHEKRLGTFYSTFYIFDGEPAAVTVSEGRLTLAAGEPAATFVFRAVRPAVLDSALAASSALSTSPILYFRCILEKVRAEWPSEAPPSSGFGALAARLRTLVPEKDRVFLADRIRAFGHPPVADEMMRNIDRPALERGLDEVVKHPAFKPSREMALGRYLGCPERDWDAKQP